MLIEGKKYTLKSTNVSLTPIPFLTSSEVTTILNFMFMIPLLFVIVYHIYLYS